MSEGCTKPGSGAATAAEFGDLLKACGWSAREVSRRVGVMEPRGYGWRNGSEVVPEDVLAWLRDVASAVRRLPAPQPVKLSRPVGRPRGDNYVLEMLRWSGRPMSVRELCDLAPQFGRQAGWPTMQQYVERLLVTQQAVRLPGRPITYAVVGQK